MRYSEFEIQAHAYFELKRVFPSVRGEYTDSSRGRNICPDLAVFDSGGKLLALVEVKKSRLRDGTKVLEMAERQSSEYSEYFGVPCLLLGGMTGVSTISQRVSDAIGWGEEKTKDNIATELKSSTSSRRGGLSSKDKLRNLALIVGFTDLEFSTDVQ